MQAAGKTAVASPVLPLLHYLAASTGRQCFFNNELRLRGSVIALFLLISTGMTITILPGNKILVFNGLYVYEK